MKIQTPTCTLEVSKKPVLVDIYQCHLALENLLAELEK